MISLKSIYSSPYRAMFIAVITISAILGLQILNAPKAIAAYDGGRIIDNAIFLDSQSMSPSSIQSFLASKGAGIANMSFVMDCDVAGQQAKQIYLSLGAPCGSTASASHIIYYASHVYGLSPKVILATIQKEQSLATAVNPTSWQLERAMGYGCPTSGGCQGASTFFYQIDNGAWVLRFHYERARGNMNWWYTSSSWTCGTPKNYYTPNLYPNQSVNFFDQNGVHYRTHFIANAATSSMYCYTPHAYNNPQGLYGKAPYGHTGMYYSGSYNFVHYFELWFGSTVAFIYNGVSYADVFDPEYYLSHYPDLQSTFGDNQINAFYHFIYYGMNEKRQAIANFNVTSYRNLYTDLRVAYENNLPAYYLHYIQHGKAEGRVATGNYSIQYLRSYRGINYSDVYDFQTYKTSNPDIQYVYNDDDAGAIRHFATTGMKEKRVAKANFNVTNYRNTYPDIRHIFGNNFPSYYMHYINHGKAEGRIATDPTMNYYSALGGINYSDVYSFTTYKNNYSDIRNAFANDDLATLKHFIQHGMHEGRMANNNFNVTIYKQRYPDLQQAFGNYMPAYYLHYIQHGKAEGRTAI